MKQLLVIIFIGLMLSSCGESESDYDRGYEDAWEGESPQKNSDSYMEGYEDGDYDADCDYYKRNKLWEKYKKLLCRN
tara:strand:+ start:404 stop:634 length:231 start_codon:yes stop_codon:yes gene_type:complete